MSKVTKYVCQLIDFPQNAIVLDVGCKNADTLLYFKEIFGEKCDRLIGIDKRSIHFPSAEKLGVAGIKLMEMDVSKGLDFPDNYFDIIFHKNTFECIDDKTSHIHELYRVLKPGGLIVCIHADWESVVFNCRNKELMNKAIYAFANWQRPWMDDFDSWIGRRLWGHFNKTGLFHGKFMCYNEVETDYIERMHGYNFFNELDCLYKQAGLITEEEFILLKNDIEETYKCGEYMFSMPYYIYIGEKVV